MRFKVARTTQPDDFERSIIAECMMAFARSAPTDFARLSNDLASSDVDVQIRARDALASRLDTEGVRSAPIPHVLSMAREAISASSGGRPIAARAGDLHAGEGTTETGIVTHETVPG